MKFSHSRKELTMNRCTALFILTALLALAALPVLAGTAPAEAAKGPETAVFEVAGLKDEALVKKLTLALADEPGILTAKADSEAGRFLVTFEPGKTSPDALTKALAKAEPGAKLEKVQPADPKAAKHDCGKCPTKAKCAGADKDKK
jgi:hypothetical protein